MPVLQYAGQAFFIRQTGFRQTAASDSKFLLQRINHSLILRFRQMNRWDRRGVMFQLRILDTDAHTFPLGRQTFGHTGFTGTCMWCDPERELSFALLTTDVYNGRANRTTGRLRKGIVEELISAIDKEATCK